MKLPTTAPVAPLSSTTTRRTVTADGDRGCSRCSRSRTDRALLGAEQVRQLRVVHLRPEADRAGAHEPGSSPRLSRCAIGVANAKPMIEPDGRHRHREPEESCARRRCGARRPSRRSRSGRTRSRCPPRATITSTAVSAVTSRSCRSPRCRGTTCRAAGAAPRGRARGCRRGRRSPSAARVAGSGRSRSHSERTVEVDQAVGHAVDVVHLLDVGAARRPELAAERRLLDERAQHARRASPSSRATTGRRMP